MCRQEKLSILSALLATLPVEVLQQPQEEQKLTMDTPLDEIKKEGISMVIERFISDGMKKSGSFDSALEKLRNISAQL